MADALADGDLVSLQPNLDWNKHPGWWKFRGIQGLVVGQVLPVLSFHEVDFPCWTILWPDNRLVSVPACILHVISKRNP